MTGLIDALEPVTDDGHLLTPWPCGLVPADVARCTDGRLQLRVTTEARALFLAVGAAMVTDTPTGHAFTLTRADCGAGCRCAAEARWAPECDVEPSKDAATVPVPVHLLRVALLWADAADEVPAPVRDRLDRLRALLP